RIGTREIALAVLATTLSLVVIFLPLAFMQGRVGRFFSSYGITVAFAIMVSLFISFTLTPMLASRFLRHTKNEKAREKKAHGGFLMRWLGDHYMRILRWSLAHRWIVMSAAALCVASLWVLIPMSRFTYFPWDDASEFEVALQTVEGSSLQRTSEICSAIEACLKALKIDGQQPIVDSLVSVGETSGGVGKGEGNVITAVIYCRLPALGGFWSTLLGQTRRWTQFQVMGMARKILEDFPDVRGGVQPVSGIGNTGRQSELQFNLTGPDLAKLGDYAEQIMTKLRTDPGFVDVDSTLFNRKPELQVHIDRVKASQFGLRVSDISGTLRTLVGGEIVGTYKEADDQYDVWLRAEAPDRDTKEALEQISMRIGGAVQGGLVGAENNSLVQLVNFVNLTESRGPNQIERFQRQRKVTVLANLSGLALGEAIDRVKGMLAELNMPPEYQAIFTGRAKSFQETGRNFLVAFGIAMVFMYMILAAQFEHFVHPISILMAVPLSLPFALLTMIVLGEQMNIYAVFGLFMLFGIVKKNGILQIDYTNTLRAQGVPREEAILQANRVRLRPILMTTMMLVASMIPIALGKGPGSAGRAAMAKVIIGGQMLCLLLTLLVTPVSYSLFDDWGKGRFFGPRRKSKKSAVPENGKVTEPVEVAQAES
ncbi:MAG TPA: efflux RND transporter permease subunit, partial [Candidatus Saccharimonadales bacterium]|nr:efflux RND transporter permease subunit [Candidatus Saccharimonadales bacterium]